MASQYKKLVKKLNPKTKKTAEKPPVKVGSDRWLLAILALTVIFLVVSWTQFDVINRVLYIALVVALGTTYARRHFNLNEKQDILAERAGIAAMAAATCLFITKIYQKFIA